MDYHFAEKQVQKPIEVKKAMESRDILQDRIREAYEQNEEFQRHKFINIFGNEREDSESMVNVKTAQMNVIDFFQRTRMSANEDEYNAQLATIKQLYSVLIAHCATYGAHHKVAISSSGKTRRRMVNQIKKLAEFELKKIDETAERIHQNQDENTDWSSVLGEMRSARIDMDTHSFETTGGGTSEVKAISFGEDKSKLFFKKEEKLTSVTEEARQEIGSRPEFAKHQEVLSRICDWISPDNAYDSFRIAVQGYQNWSTFISMTGRVMDQFTQKECDELKEIMPAFQKVFKKIHTKYGIAKDAGIERGSDLTGRNIATSRMANFLGQSRLVTEAAKVQLTSGDTVTEEGVVTRQAEGNQIDDLVKLSREKKKKIVLDPAAARDLINLEIMDTLCGQLDRNKSNLFFQHEETEDEIRLTHVTGIDSDMSFGTVGYESLQQYADGFGQLPQIDQGGVSRVPVIDAEMAHSIMALTRENLEYLLADILSEADIEALWKRAQGLQKMLEKNQDKIKDGEWSTDDVKATRGACSYLDKIKDSIPPQ